MNRRIISGVIILAAAGMIYTASSLFTSYKKKSCLEKEGSRAIEACTYIISGRASGSKGRYLVRRAELLEKEKRWDELLSDLNAIVALKGSEQARPEWVLAAYEALGKIYAKRGNTAEVKKYLELATLSGSKDLEIYVSLAEAYIEDKKFQEALSLLEIAGGLGKAKKHPYYNALAYSYEGLSDSNKAYDALKTGLSVPAPRPVLAATSKHLGLVCFDLQRYREAEMYLGYTLRVGLDCPECVLLLTTIRGALEPPEPVSRPKKTRK